MEINQKHRNEAQEDRFEVFFDGDCPLCQREIVGKTNFRVSNLRTLRVPTSSLSTALCKR